MNELRLTKRHIQILKLIAKGYTQREIADLLFIANSTVNNHSVAIYKRLKARNAPHAVKIALQNDLIGMLDIAEDDFEKRD